MSLCFKTICSSSSGNCLLLWSDKTRVIIDCGLNSMKRTRQLLTTHLSNPSDVDAVIFTHMHGNHCSYYPLRVLQEQGLQIKLHENSINKFNERHCERLFFGTLKLKPFNDNSFKIGELIFEPFEVPHNPYYKTYGFMVKYKRKKIVLATDFHNWNGVLGNFIDADFIYVESNHDLELLRINPNPNSRFHMNNIMTGKLLTTVRKNSKRAPNEVMLGHLSNERNNADIALTEIGNSFRNSGVDMDFKLSAAPLYEASEVVRVYR